ncbi:transcription factor bHLH18 [Vigna radiata var. radiata]|uniref:Transcription factor bHLH18 n=1 Tax=Vigna radiata var. radiata TaxID=3916 RepID=A0A1S3UR55_VIGRR|nr:transcription factor bHLH18 [Vigna radiata var. radiata]
MTSMEESWTSWLCDMEPDDYSFIGQSDIKVEDVNGSLASPRDIATALEENPQSSFSTESHSSVTESGIEERPLKLLKTCTSNSAKTEQLSQMRASTPCSYILSFDNTNPPTAKVESATKPETKVVKRGIALPSKNESKRVTQESKKTGSSTRSSHHTQDHIIAERMRREKISQQFIALSSLIPDLKKMDKVSVLVEAIRYVKELKEKVKVMEGQRKRKSHEPVTCGKKSQVCAAADEDVSDTSSNSDEFGNSDDPSSKTNLLLPEVEARVSKKNVLIRILCEKEKAVLANIFREIEKLHLSVINSSALSFGSSVLDATIVAEMEDEFNMSVKELAGNLRVGLMQFM